MGSLSGRRILVIEDETLINMLLVDVLEDAGAVVLGPATTLQRALAMAGAEHMDAAIVDVNLGGEKSWPVATLLASRDVPYVFTTAYARHSEPALQQAPFLAKPYGVRDLLAAVEALVATPDADPRA